MSDTKIQNVIIQSVLIALNLYCYLTVRAKCLYYRDLCVKNGGFLAVLANVAVVERELV